MLSGVALSPLSRRRRAIRRSSLLISANAGPSENTARPRVVRSALAPLISAANPLFLRLLKRLLMGLRMLAAAGLWSPQTGQELRWMQPNSVANTDHGVRFSE